MKCKIGDLAILIRASVDSNLGAFVEVIAVYPDRRSAWWVRSLSGPRLRADGTIEDMGAANDCNLHPIRGNATQPKPRTQRVKKTLRKRPKVANAVLAAPAELTAP